MEILQFLLSLLSNGDNAQKLSPILNLFNGGNLDLKSMLSNLNFESVIPIIQAFFGWQNKSPTENTVGQQVGLSAVTDIADKEIICTLNKYFSR